MPRISIVPGPLRCAMFNFSLPLYNTLVPALVARVNNGDLLLLVVIDTFVNRGSESLVILLEQYHLSFILLLDSSNNIAGLYLENNYCGELREFPFEIKVCDREESNGKN